VFQITKEFHFSAAHQLPNLPDGHPCGRLHGHNYVVVVVLEADVMDVMGKPDPLPWVRDFGDLYIVRDYINDFLDHKNLNDWFADQGWGATTAENLAYQLFHQFVEYIPQVVAVRVSETPKTWAEYRLG